MDERPAFIVREVKDEDSSWIKEIMTSHWGGREVIVHGDIYLPDQLPGYVAVTTSDEKIGLVTYKKQADCWEIITLNSLLPGIGVGTALLSTVQVDARRAGNIRLTLTTTNDNSQAIRFYQNRGFSVVLIRQGAVEEARKLKPSIPFLSPEGHPIRDEVDLEIKL
jgi:GNAT superfamily N-acetyltransferase